jgi:hypothetical protein
MGVVNKDDYEEYKAMKFEQENMLKPVEDDIDKEKVCAPIPAIEIVQKPPTTSAGKEEVTEHPAETATIVDTPAPSAGLLSEKCVQCTKYVLIRSLWFNVLVTSH